MAETPNADRLAAMSDAELIESAVSSQDTAWLSIHALDRIASLVVEKLGQSVIPSSIPARIGEWIRQTATHNTIFWTNSIPMYGSGGMIQNWVLNPDGTLHLELRDNNNQMFWRGTFRPADE